jgi:hypothetical protein
MLKRLLRFFFFLLVTGTLLWCSSCQNQSLVLDQLLTDMKAYKTYSHHRGDLYEHSMWVEQYMSRWAMGQDKEMNWVQQWMANFTEREKYIVALAGLLHDIGKAGDPDCSKNESYRKDGVNILYWSKKEHEYVGFEYVMHDIGDAAKFKQGYLNVNGQPLNFKQLFNELHIADQEQRIVAVLIGSHKLFPLLLVHQKTEKVTEKTFIEKVKKLLRESGVTTPLNEKILSMVMVLSIADLCASYFPVEQPGPSLVFGKFILCKKVHEFPEEASMVAAIKEKFTMRAPAVRCKIFANLCSCGIK